MRIILYTGKGGVGKTSIAAATALRVAELGYKTIVLSTDSAHSLSDSFDTSLGGKPQLIAPNLWGQETNMTQTLRTYWDTVKSWMAALLAWRGVDEIIADEMAILPGMEELANLLYIAHYSDSEEYDVAIVDCAPTGETLRLLSFPEVLRWWMDRMFPVGRMAAHILRPAIKFASGMPMPSDEVFDSAEHLFSELNKIQDLLANTEKASMRLVINPEKMVIKETQRTFTYLNLYGYHTDLVICNRLIPDEIKDPYFDYWKRNQSEYYSMIEQSFAPVPILTLPLFEREIVGMPMLCTIGKTLYGDDDPSRLFFRGQIQSMEGDDSSYTLNLALPFIAKGDIGLMRSNDELIVQVGHFRRNIILPNVLSGLAIVGAKFEGDKLKIKFAKEDKSKE
jgi:arsenite-activated ATPase (arsA)